MLSFVPSNMFIFTEHRAHPYIFCNSSFRKLSSGMICRILSGPMHWPDHHQNLTHNCTQPLEISSTASGWIQMSSLEEFLSSTCPKHPWRYKDVYLAACLTPWVAGTWWTEPQPCVSVYSCHNQTQSFFKTQHPWYCDTMHVHR